MDDPSLLRALFEYNDWAIHRILARAEGLEPDLLTAPTAMPRGSLWDTLFHALGAEWLWTQRCRGVSPDHNLPEPPERTVPVFRKMWERQHADSLALINSLSKQDLDRLIRYSTMHGDPDEGRIGNMLLHAGTHTVQHRTEAAQILTEYGRSPGDLDFDDFVWYRNHPGYIEAEGQA